MVGPNLEHLDKYIFFCRYLWQIFLFCRYWLLEVYWTIIQDNPKRWANIREPDQCWHYSNLSFQRNGNLVELTHRLHIYKCEWVRLNSLRNLSTIWYLAHCSMIIVRMQSHNYIWKSTPRQLKIKWNYRTSEEYPNVQIYTWRSSLEDHDNMHPPHMIGDIYFHLIRNYTNKESFSI